MGRRQFDGDALGLVAALRVHDGDVYALFGQRVTDALPQSAITAGHQRDRALELHGLSPTFSEHRYLTPAQGC